VAPEPLTLSGLRTPALLLDRQRLVRNVDRLSRRLRELGTPLRPHLKTAKCLEVVRLMAGGWPAPVTVSTLREAEAAAGWGARDILYAVGLAPAKTPDVMALRSQGVDLSVVTDDLEAARAIGSAAAGQGLPVLIEVDADGHRSGIAPEEPERLLAVARALAEAGCEMRGIMTHAGESYGAAGPAELRACAERERSAALEAARVLRSAGFACPVVSVGSTPTSLFAESLQGVTEVRNGVYAFFDLEMAGLGVCAVDDIALSVLATVIGRQSAKGWILVDAGWMALSCDRGRGGRPVDNGYGLVCDPDGAPYPDLIVLRANQEHGVLALRPGSAAELPPLQVGDRVRILPNHACATAAQHSRYHVTQPGRDAVTDVWERFGGW
jgi:D-serine deaminase-like pyridoxal phosphate-dependent protein